MVERAGQSRRRPAWQSCAGAWVLMAALVYPAMGQQQSSDPAAPPPEPAPTNPEPTQPEPAKPNPAKPAPVDPETDQTHRRNQAAEEGLAPAAVPQNKPAPAAKPNAPANTAIPVPRAKRAREGVFIVKQPGELLVAKTGDVVFVPDKGAPVRTSRPMVLLPCQALARLESAAGLHSESPTADRARPRAVLTGQILVYRQREYLLPTVFQVELPGTTPAAKETAPAPAAQPGTDTGAEPAANSDNRDREVESFIEELEDRRARNRGLTREMAENTAPPAAPATKDGEAQAATAERSWSAPEGTVITARRGRLVRLVDGAIGVSFDNGMTPGASARRTEPAMALQPCQLTQRMEDVVGGRGDRMQLEVSGRVFSYGGRSYLLPTMYKVLPPSDIGPLN